MNATTFDATPLDAADGTGSLPPDAAERDAAKRAENGDDDVLRGDDFRFATRHLSDEERAAVVAVLTGARFEESRSVKRIERRELQPWARSQRVPVRIPDPYGEG